MTLEALEASCLTAIAAIDNHTESIRGGVDFKEIAAGLETALAFCAPASEARSRMVVIAEKARAALERRRDVLLAEAAEVEATMIAMRAKTEKGSS